MIKSNIFMWAIAFVYDLMITTAPFWIGVSIGFTVTGWAGIIAMWIGVIIMWILARKWEPPKGPFMRRLVGVYND